MHTVIDQRQNSRLTTRIIIFWKFFLSIPHSDMRNFLKTVLSSDNTKIYAVESSWSDIWVLWQKPTNKVYFVFLRAQVSSFKRIKMSSWNHSLENFGACSVFRFTRCKRYKVLLYLYWGSWLSTKKQKGQHIIVTSIKTK